MIFYKKLNIIDSIYFVLGVFVLPKLNALFLLYVRHLSGPQNASVPRNRNLRPTPLIRTRGVRYVYACVSRDRKWVPFAVRTWPKNIRLAVTDRFCTRSRRIFRTARTKFSLRRGKPRQTGSLQNKTTYGSSRNV